jgi:energy-coupling factor transport system substrate-specific component
MRPRPGSSGRDLAIGTVVAVGLLTVLAILALGVWQVSSRGPELAPASDETLFLALGWLAMLLVVATGVGLVILLVRRRDLAVAYLVVAGAVTGVTAALVAAPIAASLFGGVTGSGADFLIAALRQAGASLQQAVLTQSLVSDPIDKVVTYFVVYVILGALAVRTVVRFPQGRYLVPDRAEASEAVGEKVERAEVT